MSRVDKLDISPLCPATGQPLATVSECDAADVDTAVAAARAAFDAGTWSRVAPSERKAKLLKLPDLIERDLAIRFFAG